MEFNNIKFICITIGVIYKHTKNDKTDKRFYKYTCKQ